MESSTSNAEKGQEAQLVQALVSFDRQTKKIVQARYICLTDVESSILDEALQPLFKESEAA